MAARDWSSLHVDLLGTIALKLESFEDFMYFSEVCTSWKRASSSIKHQWRARPEVPWLLLAESKKENPDCVREVFNLSNKKCYKLRLPETFGARCWGSAYGWIALVKRDFTVQLFNPFTKANISTFPSWEALSLNLPNDRPNPLALPDNNWFLIFLMRIIVLKVSQSFVVFMIYDINKLRLAFARQGDKSWTSVSVTDVYDVVAAEEDGLVFALTYPGSIVSWNVNDDRSELVQPMVYSRGRSKRDWEWRAGNTNQYLIRSGGGDLFMVTRCVEDLYDSDDSENLDPDIPYQAANFIIRKLNHQDRKWEIVEDDLGDVVMFVGQNSSMSVFVAPQFECLQRNSIYFTDDEDVWWVNQKDQEGGHDMGVFDVKSKVITDLDYDGEDILSSFCGPTWFIPQL